jgi:hypothetical protein
MRLGERDRLVSLAFADRLVRTDFVEPLALNPPPALVELENGGCVPVGVGKLERTRIEVNADQGEQAAGLPVTGPQNIVMPMARFPSLAKGRVGLTENRDKPGFKPLTMLVKEKPGVIDMHIFDDLANRPPQNQPGRQEANYQDAGPDEKSHDRIPGDVLE